MAAARAGQTTATGLLYERHRDAAVQFAAQLGGSSSAEDLVTIAFMRVFRTLAVGHGPDDDATSSFRAYLFRAIHNVYVDAVRRNSRLPAAGFQELDDIAVPPDVDLVIESSALAAAFATLPRRWQLVIWWTAVDRLSHGEIAERLAISASAVGALNYRARAGLRAAYLDSLTTEPCTWPKAHADGRTHRGARSVVA